MSLTFIINYYYYLVTFLSPFLFFPSNPPPQFQYIQVFFHSFKQVQVCGMMPNN